MMKKFLTLILALAMVLSLAACGGKEDTTTKAPEADTKQADTTKAADAVQPDKDYVIRIYSNSNSSERVTWLVAQAEKEQCGLFVVTGDLFDKTYSIRVADVKKIAEILSRFPGPVL